MRLLEDFALADAENKLEPALEPEPALELARMLVALAALRLLAAIALAARRVRWRRRELVELAEFAPNAELEERRAAAPSAERGDTDERERDSRLETMFSRERLETLQK